MASVMNMIREVLIQCDLHNVERPKRFTMNYEEMVELYGEPLFQSQDRTECRGYVLGIPIYYKDTR